jgi:hypothetical protein
LDDDRPCHELEYKENDNEDEQNYRAFDVQKLYKDLQRYDYLQDKMRIEDETLAIELHKYLSVSIYDDCCEFFHTHWHPADDGETLEFVSSLLYEQTIFVDNRFTHLHKMYPGYYLDKRRKSKNKMGYRVFSAIKSYIDN